MDAGKLRFAVDDDSSEEARVKAWRELRRMAKLGRVAQRAIDSIRATGSYPGKVPLAGAVGHKYYHGYGGGTLGMDVRLCRLPALVGVSRADLGDLSLLQARLGTVRKTSYSGHDCTDVELRVAGPFLFQLYEESDDYEVRDYEWPVGKIRINKGHLSWLPESYGTTAHRVYKESLRPEARKSVEAFAQSLSKELVRTDSTQMKKRQKTTDLQKNAWRWIADDGHVDRLFREIHQAITVLKVMES